MEATVLSIHWHDNNRAIYSVDFQKSQNKTNISSSVKVNEVLRLATGGGDNNVRIWEVTFKEKKPIVKYLSTLSKHTQAVNVVRFSPTNQNLLATAGDDGIIFIWEKSEKVIKDFNNTDFLDLESWSVKYSYRFSVTSEVYDLCWSPDGKYIIIGSMDNLVRVFTSELKLIKELNNHTHYVQGVAWDPYNQYVASQSVDRLISIYKIISNENNVLDFTLLNKTFKADLPRKLRKRTLSSDLEINPLKKKPRENDASEKVNDVISDNIDEEKMKDDDNGSNLESDERLLKQDKPYRNALIYHNETLLSFFRRLSFSPDGSILLTPTGIFKNTNKNSKEEIINTVYGYIRSQFDKGPIFQLPNLKKPAIAIKFSSQIYRLKPIDTQEDSKTLNFVKSQQKEIIKITELQEEVNDNQEILRLTKLLSLPYRMLFAVATQDSMILYDTSNIYPIAVVKNLHYSNFTDISWSDSGHNLIISSTDGFCSLIQLDSLFIGELYKGKVGIELIQDIRNEKDDKEAKDMEKLATEPPELLEKTTIPNVIDIQSLVRKKKRP